MCLDNVGQTISQLMWAATSWVSLSKAQPNQYNGIPLNRRPSRADTHDITDNSESPNCPYIHFNNQATPEQQTLHYSV